MGLQHPTTRFSLRVGEITGGSSDAISCGTHGLARLQGLDSEGEDEIASVGLKACPVCKSGLSRLSESKRALQAMPRARRGVSWVVRVFTAIVMA